VTWFVLGLFCFLQSAIDTALADGECNALEKAEDRMSCYLTKVCTFIRFRCYTVIVIPRQCGGFCASEGLNRELLQALANVGAELAHQVPGRVSTEIDARLAYDTQGIIHRVWCFIFMFPLLEWNLVHIHKYYGSSVSIIVC
jgi:transaldolase